MMSELNFLSRYVCLENVDNSHIEKVGSTLDNWNIINAFLQDNMVVPTENDIYIFYVGRINTVRTVSHVGEGNYDVASVFLFKDFTYSF